MTTLLKPTLRQPICSSQDLVDYLARGARPPEQWGIGIELESLVLEAASGEAASFERVESLLQRLECATGWQGLREGGHLIGLLGPASSITLEPGGQLELSGELCPDLHCSRQGYLSYIQAIATLGDELGLVFCGLGVQPFTPLAQITNVPKSRYGIMGPYMQRTGDMGLRMMKQSAGVQVNVDFSDAADCLRKMRLAMGLVPLVYALFANSPVMEDQPTGFLSTRGEIWSRTDPDRTGLIDRLFAEDAGLADFVDYALDIPMYFIWRDGGFIDLTQTRFTFRDFLRSGHLSHRPILSDWDLHLSTLFPEVRLRPHIEVRSADSLPPRFALAVGAFLKGILYDPQSAAEAWGLLKEFSAAERTRLYHQSWRLGLQTPAGDSTLQELGVATLELARQGLVRQGCCNSSGEDETIFLSGIAELAAEGKSPAQQLLEHWHGSRADKLAVLKNHCGLGLGAAR